MALNEYIHHVVEMLQLKVAEAQFTSNLLPTACKSQKTNFHTKVSYLVKLSKHKLNEEIF